MKATREFNYKHHSLEKWNTIVELFEELREEECKECGYCEVYFNQEGDCLDCPLYKKEACSNQRTPTSYWTVLSSIADGLQEAKFIKEVIQDDLEEYIV